MKFRSILPQTLRPVLHTLFLPLHQMKTLTARLVGLLASCGKWMGEGGRLHVEISWLIYFTADKCQAQHLAMLLIYSSERTLQKQRSFKAFPDPCLVKHFSPTLVSWQTPLPNPCLVRHDRRAKDVTVLSPLCPSSLQRSRLPYHHCHWSHAQISGQSHS